MVSWSFSVLAINRWIALLSYLARDNFYPVTEDRIIIKFQVSSKLLGPQMLCLVNFGCLMVWGPATVT